ncbi:uncharacterized protein at1g66480 [Phtheirospermum japonicum]|uniref:Uncharacterized protein at1g66480 n=1 Tax=Phtheirospermum japonicum TaxID=374723 RepID=A0A830BI08_9LAMI|nr:uncharacterized protein at1g66480 [Phtheirospermum japonicum]
MKINGETLKLKIPVRAGSVMQNHPAHVLLESEAVRHYGVRAKPLEPQQELKPSRLYFLVQLSKLPERKAPRRVRSATHTSAKDRLESLMLARRSASDLGAVKPGVLANGGGAGGVRFRMRLPKAEVERLVSESKDAAEVAEKIVGLCIAGGGGAAEQSVDWKGAYDQRGPILRQVCFHLLIYILILNVAPFLW